MTKIYKTKQKKYKPSVFRSQSLSICIHIFFFIFSCAVTGQSGKDVYTRIDTHIHIYDTQREGSSVFLNPVKHQKIYFPHLEKEFLNTASPAGINCAIVVEASKRREDNFWAMQVVNDSPNLLAFIANLNPMDSTFTADLEVLSKHVKFRGIRIRPIGKINLSDEAVIEKMGELAKRDLVLELGPRQGSIEAIETIAKTYSELTIIMNHMAGGRIDDAEIIPNNWNKRLEKLAALPNVYCKISALYTLSGKSPAPIDEAYYNLFIDQVVNAFGAYRVMFGSNWTLSEMLGSYTHMIQMLDAYLDTRSDLDAEQFYHTNAVKAYGL